MRTFFFSVILPALHDMTFDTEKCCISIQISTKEHLEDSLLECTMQDLIRYDDYNNDSYLTLHEFYTAFRESLLFFFFFSLLWSSVQPTTIF